MKTTTSVRFIPFDFTGLFVKNLMMWFIPYVVIISLLDNYTSIPLSMEDGLAANYYLMPMLIIGLGLGIYCLLYEYKKVKGTWLLK
jgi:hypothetical protein